MYRSFPKPKTPSKIFRIATNRSNLIPATNIKDLIENLLKNIMPDPQDYISPEQMLIWHRAFTNDTFDPTNNYEDQEYIGDRNLKVLFILYLLNRNPLYTPKDLTNIDTLVMEKKNQNDLSFELGFIDLIKMPHHSKPPIGVGGDVFESFFGALDEVSELVLPTIGLIHSYNMITYIFNQNIIPDDLRLGNTKMIVEQIFIQLGLKNPAPIIEQGQQVTVTIELTDDHLEFFNLHDLIVPKILASQQNYAKNVATKLAYDQAKTTLENVGVTEEFIEQLKAQKEKKEVIREKVAREPLNIEVKVLVERLLMSILKKSEVEKYVTGTLMETWEKVFEEDDKMLIYLGEIILKGFIARHLGHLYKGTDYNKEDFNNIITNMIKNYDDFLITPNTKHLKGVLKPFFGALMRVSDTILPGAGIINCYHLIEEIFKKELIPFEYRYKHPKTAVEQLFSPFFGKDKSKPILTIGNENDEYVFDVKLTLEQMSFLRKQGFKIPNTLLAHKTGTMKKQTQKEVYEMALKKLESYGINREWRDTLKKKMEFTHPQLSVYSGMLDKKTKQDGYEYIYFASPSKTTTQNEITIQLVGVRDGTKTILSSVIDNTGGNKIDSKINLIKNYLQIK